MQLENLHIVDEERRIFEGTATIEMPDNTGIIVPIDEVESFMDKYLARGGTLSLEHTNQHVGKVLEYWRTEILVTPELVARAIEVNPKVGALVRRFEGQTLPAIGVRAQLFHDYAFEDDIWDRIKNQTRPDALRGLSFGGRSAPVSYDEERKGIVHTVRAAWEFALCQVPRVALALLSGVNEIAQAEDKELVKDAIAHGQACHACGTSLNQKEEPLMTEEDIKQGKTYITNPAEAPKGANVQRGARGGYYYEDKGGDSGGSGNKESSVTREHRQKAAQFISELKEMGSTKEISEAIQKLNPEKAAHLAQVAKDAGDVMAKQINTTKSEELQAKLQKTLRVFRHISSTASKVASSKGGDGASKPVRFKKSKLYKEDVHGDEPQYHVFYADGTKSKQFGDVASARKFRAQLEEADTKQTETLNKTKKEEVSMNQSDEEQKAPATEEKESELELIDDEETEDTEEVEASEERSESPQSATVDALAAEVAELKTRLATLEERAAPAAPVAQEGAAPVGEDGAPLELVKDTEQAVDEEAPAEAPAEEGDAPAQDSEEPASEEPPFEKKDEDEETKQSTTPKTRLIESEARGEGEITQALAMEQPKFDPVAIATGNQQVSYQELRGHKQ